MRLSQFTVTKLAETIDGDTVYADYEVRCNNEVCTLTSVAISGPSVGKKTKLDLVLMSDLADYYEGR